MTIKCDGNGCKTTIQRPSEEFPTASLRVVIVAAKFNGWSIGEVFQNGKALHLCPVCKPATEVKP